MWMLPYAKDTFGILTKIENNFKWKITIVDILLLSVGAMVFNPTITVRTCEVQKKHVKVQCERASTQKIVALHSLILWYCIQPFC